MYLTGFTMRNKSQDLIVFCLWLPLAIACLLIGGGILPPEAAFAPAVLFLGLLYVHCCPAHFGAFWAKRAAEQAVKDKDNSGSVGGET